LPKQQGRADVHAGKGGLQRQLVGVKLGNHVPQITGKQAESFGNRLLSGQLDNPALDIARLGGATSGGFDDRVAAAEGTGVDAENAGHGAHHLGCGDFGQKKKRKH